MPARAPPDHDPLDAVLRPPFDETPDEKAYRLAQEEEARRISAAIDESIRQEKLRRKKTKIVRLLLLGQSESGKSTTLRQFQRLYTPSAFRAERHLWRAIIQLNLVRSVHTILDALTDIRRDDLAPGLSYADTIHRPASPYSTPPFGSPRPLPRIPGPAGSTDSEPSSPRDRTAFAPARQKRASDPPSSDEVQPAYTSEPENDDDDPDAQTALPPHLSALRARLDALRKVESLLIARLVPPSEGEAVELGPHPHISEHAGAHGNGNGNGAYANGFGYVNGNGADAPPRRTEIFVRAGTAWKGRVQRLRAAPLSPTSDGGDDAELDSDPSAIAQQTIHTCSGALRALWADETVRRVLRRRKIRLEEWPGLQVSYLNDLERVTAPKYMPSDDDVLKARLKTVGVSEHRFEMEAGTESGTEWRIIDVGGSRSQVPTWVPFFDDAIIFLAPICAFDQTLAEDKSVNRLEDSVLLWKAVCSNKLLANVDLVLFLNKCDILSKKLASGVRLAKYVRSFGNRTNDSETAEKYFRSKFSAIHREYSPIPRKFYGFCTSVTDSTTTGGILASVRDMVVREHLRGARLL
ncbi:G-alpha-domain-containing protein [Obba rivulosa]|uniref:G-alpha-domain-containing protein n=1 Tax=Obba rivulosa TaxID=1052685 RepID=A0A8E2AXC8_9APHY|nr:G-alpha-domain-containing protein [Obba rivulosa]